MGCLRTQTAALLLFALAALAAGHGEENTNMAMRSINYTANSTSVPDRGWNYNLFDEPNYASLEAHSSLMVAHIAFEILAWFFVLPVGKWSK